MSEQKNFIYAMVLSVAIFFTWDHFFGVKVQPQAEVQHKELSKPVETTSSQPEAASDLTEKMDATVLDRQDAVKDNRLSIDTEKLQGSLNLKGCQLDDITFKDYKSKIDADSPLVDLLNPKNTKDFYYIDFDVLADDHVVRPLKDTLWTINEGSKLTTTQPVVVFYENEQGIRFERSYKIDEQYMITVSQKVINKSSMPINVQQKASIKRHKPNLDESTYILHEGAVGYLDNHLVEKGYDKLSETPNEEIVSKGGWLGFADKYWLVALIPNQDVSTTFQMQSTQGQEFSTSLKLDKKLIQPGETIEQSVQIYVGPKKLSLLDTYEELHKIKKFDLAIDFGWFYFLTKPLFQFLDWMNKLVGNFGIAILIMTLLSKIILFPLANKSFYSMARMKAMGPKVEALKAKYEKDPVKMQQELMGLYKKEKVNPLSGCLPMLIQAPIFFCLYKVLYISIEMRHAPFYGWIHDLSAKDPTSIFNIFGLIPWDPPGFLMIGIWPLLMGATMLFQQRLNPQPVDPAQAKMMLLMPIFFTYLFASFPAGLVIYWTFSNILSIIQQQVITKIAEKKQK